MSTINCCPSLFGRKKKNKVVNESSSKAADCQTAIKTLNISIKQPVKSFEGEESKTASLDVSLSPGVHMDSLKGKVLSHGSPFGDEASEVAYEGEDEHEENNLMKRDFSDIDLQSHVANSRAEESIPNNSSGSFDAKHNEKISEKNVDVIQSGHVSDPGIAKADFWGSPKLNRSCSNLETSKVVKKIDDRLYSESLYSGQLRGMPEILREIGSPRSVMTHGSADRVMLKKHSSSQVLPSRSRKLWWKLFLWSHRNLHNLQAVKPQTKAVTAALNQQGGYFSDTLEPKQDKESSKMQSSGSFTGESTNKVSNNNEDEKIWDGFHGGVFGLPQNHWVAFASEPSPLSRVDEWVRGLETQPLPLETDDRNEDKYHNDEAIIFPPPPETGRSPGRNTPNLTRRPDISLTAEILHANSVIQSLNSSSTVAHISGIGLKAIPTMSCFSSLRSVNLSDNFIVCITPGSLPKGLHTLNLSRNKINTIEGLRDLTRLRVLDLSYNRISRIGQGLSNCSIIKNLYLAGNRISDVEGLHRLLKLTVLDLSFNKITTTKALGLLVANYNSLQALNLLGNPIQSNINDDQLRKAVSGLLPKLVFLNKQPIKPHGGRDSLTDDVAKAALGSSSSSKSSRRRAIKRVGTSGSTASALGTSVGAGQRSRHRSTSRTRHLKTKSSWPATSTR